MSIAQDDAQRVAFLRCCQRGELDVARRLLAEAPSIADARSTSKGYSAMHFAAMGGATDVCEWLETVGLTVEMESPDGTTPLQVALEYKRLATARRLQAIRDLRRKGVDWKAEARANAVATAEEEAKARAEAEAKSRAESEARAVAEAAAAAAAAEAAAAEAKAKAEAAVRLSTANREAAAQALAAGKRALSSGDMMKAVRLLRKARSLSPEDEDVAAALAEAEREYNAVLREQEAEREAARAEAAEQQREWNLPPPPPSATPARCLPPRSEASSIDGSGAAMPPRSKGAKGGSSSESADASVPSAATDRATRLATVVLSLLAAVARLLAQLSRACGLAYLGHVGGRALAGLWSVAVGWPLRKFEELFSLEPDTRERLAYLFYYWRARLRWPLRFLGLLLLLLLAWRYPWHAYAVVVLAVGGGATYFAPYMPYVGALAWPQLAMGSAAAGLALICYLLPYTTAWLVGGGLWVGLAYLSWQACAVLSAVLLLFCYLPTLALGLVAAVGWLLFLSILPRICLLLTELGVGCYFFPFHWIFLHAVGISLLIASSDLRFLLPLGIMCTPCSRLPPHPTPPHPTQRCPPTCFV